MDKEGHLKAMLERAKELKEIAEKLMEQSDQLMGEYEALKLKKRGKPQTSPVKDLNSPMHRRTGEATGLSLVEPY